MALARSTAIHESQSLFFEMQLARSTPFLQHILPLVTAQMGEQSALNSGNFVRLNQRVKRGFIRLDADEVSYSLHIVLRYEIERALIAGDIEVNDIPALWDEKMQRYPGLDTRGNYRDGCMQDIHWTDGAFGYFPTYTLGAMYAAQLFQALKRVLPQLDDQIARGELQPIFNWFSQTIWQHGGRFPTTQLIAQASGAALQPLHFRRHLERRYLG